MFTENLLMQFSLTLTNFFIEMFVFRDDGSKHNCNCKRNSADFFNSRRENIATPEGHEKY